MRKILILAANPKNTTLLRLSEEVRDISEGLERAQYRKEFRLSQRWAVRPRDFRRAILDESPSIIHFSGHSHEDGLFLEGRAGQSQLITTSALAHSFKFFSQKIKIQCVILNGCYSEAQAKAIAEYVPYVIGMQKSVGDRAAIEFSVGFYDSLGAGQSVEFAFDAGCIAMDLESSGCSKEPILIQGKILSHGSKRSLTRSSNRLISPVLSAVLSEKFTLGRRSLLQIISLMGLGLILTGLVYFFRSPYDPAMLRRNLVYNGGAEQGLEGWDVSNNYTTRSSDPQPHGGQFYFFPGQNKNSEATQDISLLGLTTLIDSNRVACTVKGYMRDYENADESQIIIDFFLENHSLVNRIESPIVKSSEDWIEFAREYKLAPGTRSVRITLLSTYRQGLKNNDGYFDDIEFLCRKLTA